jgi:hypothetical protein
LNYKYDVENKEMTKVESDCSKALFQITSILHQQVRMALKPAFSPHHYYIIACLWCFTSAKAAGGQQKVLSLFKIV